jgi:drug/metabolite transporter (DMT)-like permease
VTFLQIVWASLLGAVVFGEAVDPWVILGGTVIIGAISLSTLGEARAAAQRRAALLPEV